MITQSVGTAFRVTLGLPATYDLAGFPALTFHEVGEVGAIPTFGGQSQTTEFVPAKSGVVDKRVGSTNYGSITVPLAWVIDYGHHVLQIGFDGINRGKTHSFKIYHADIGTIYFTGVITAYRAVFNDANTIVQAEVTVELTNKLIIEATIPLTAISLIGGGYLETLTPGDYITTI